MQLPLPPKELRMNSLHERDDNTYLRSASTLVKSVEAILALDRFSVCKRDIDSVSEMSILDFGSGTARFLHGLGAEGRLPSKYVGIDVQEAQIEWCSYALGPLGNFHFQCIDAWNDRYNPSGKKIAGELIAEEYLGVDFVIARSVLGHMRKKEAYRALKEIRRAVAPTGRAYVTVHVRNNVPTWTDKPDGIDGKNILLKVQFNKNYFENILEDVGFVVSVFCASVENQCVYLLRPV